MALPADYVSGTITLTAGSTAFTGTGTGWLAADFREGDIILDVLGGDNRVAVVAAVTGNGAGTLTKPWEGPTLANVAYRLRYQWDSGRVSAQTRSLIEQLGNGNLQSLAAVTGAAGNVVVFNGPGDIGTEPRTNFINGVAYDVQVNTLADRAAYNGQSAGFTVLVSNVGDGRSAIYSKASNASGDWTNAAYVTGPVGPNPTITASATTLAPGSSATVTTTPITGGVNLALGIPAGEGFVSRGAYSGATAYVKGDVVTNNNSSWIARIATTGNAPPVLPTTSNTQWQLLAAKGTDGTGTGDVVGPTSSVNNNIAQFNGTTGKIIKEITPVALRTLIDAQPLDADLTAIADLVTTVFGRGLLTQANASTLWALLGGSSSFTGVTGSVRFPGGFHIQYGLVRGSGAKTFPVAFGNSVFGVVGSVLATETTDQVRIFQISAYSLSGFTAQPRFVNPTVILATGSEDCLWLAWGVTV